MATPLPLTGNAYTGARWRAGLPPGVYEVQAGAEQRKQVRLDMAAFVGLAERGPVGIPVPLQSWPAFQAAFGAPIEGLQGPLAVRLFFENGGRQCLFIRVVDPDQARAARLLLPGLGPLAAVSARSAGSWANRLSLRLRVNRRILPLRRAIGMPPWTDGTLLAPMDRAVAGTTITLAGDPPDMVRHIVDVGRPTGGLTAILIDPPVAPTVEEIRLSATEALTLQLDIALNDSLVESWSDAALHPFHPDHLPYLLDRAALVEKLAPGDVDAPYGSQFLRPDPSLIDHVLMPSLALMLAPDGLFFDARTLEDDDRGFDAAGTTTRDHFIDALDALTLWDERSETAPVALVALPDLVHPPQREADIALAAPPAETCFGPCLHQPAPLAASPLLYPKLGADSRAELGAAQLRFVRHCEAHGRRMALLDLPTGLSSGEIIAWRRALASPRAALFTPWLRIDNADGVAVPPAAAVAGLIARAERDVGVFASPGATTLHGIFALAGDAGLPGPGFLHEERIDQIRATEKGLQLMGSRTTAFDAEWTHISVRRLLDWLALQLAIDLAWAPFEPNDGALWRAMIRTAERRLLALLDAGALAGGRASDSFFIRCDRSTMAQSDLDFGRAIMLVGVAPAVPSEFLLFNLVRHGADDPRMEVTA
ncbi:hypothetical protein PMI04_000740 [Sphingobium sp. AP49]|uniref:hypothetical protein n=1 Tax=Sphingobium sp. AP49 TaxID=1144307 RepID=UPI0024B3227D|nr:hypothetical protein [Sphingobium sp. AP49]WHO39163.1 hypothetical protein PMI04_000740 [Sphingobium sp. AP49]